jgi:uncharacterized protein (TIRG00374 family)
MNKIKPAIGTAIRLSIAGGLLVYLASSGALEWTALRGLLANWPLTLLALAVFLVDLVITAWRLCVLFRPANLYLSLGASVRLSLIGSFFNTCLPGASGGDLVKIYYAVNLNRGRRMEVVTLMLLDRALGMFALVLLPLLIIPMFPGLVHQSPSLKVLLLIAALVVIAMLVGFGLALHTNLRNNSTLNRLLDRLPLGRLVHTILDTLQIYRRNKRTLIATVGISLVAHTLTVIVAVLIALVINPAGFDSMMLVLIPIGFLANTLPLTPGGLGVGEAAFDQLFGLAGLQGGAEILFGWRILLIIVSLSGLVFYLQGRSQFAQDRASNELANTA